MIHPDDRQALGNMYSELRKASERIKRLSKLVELDDPERHSRIWDWGIKLEDLLVELIGFIGGPSGVIADTEVKAQEDTN